LLVEAGYPDGLETTLVTYAMDEVMKNIATAVQGSLSEVGIKANLELPEGAMYIAEYTNGTWNNKLVHEAMARFSGNYLSTFSYYLNPDSMWFKSLARPQAYIDQFNKAISTTVLDPADVQKISQIIYDEAMVIPTAINVLVYAYADYVKDADWMNQGTSYGMWRPENTWLDK
jgi:ABC-type transport system substrate-binding protein